MPTTPATRLVDSHFGGDSHAYTLTRVYHLTHRNRTTHIPRVEVHRDFYPHQSHARACVVATSLTWMPIADRTPDHWHPHAPIPAGTVSDAQLDATAEELLARAQRILTPPDTSTGRSRP